MAWLAATKLYSQGRYREAITLYNRGLIESSRHPAIEAVRLDLAYSLFRNGQVTLAIAQLQQAMNLQPKYKETILKLAHLQAWIGRDSDVVVTVSQGISQIGASKQLLALLAISSLRLRVPIEFTHNVLKQAELFENSNDARAEHLLKVAHAKYTLANGNIHTGRKSLIQLCDTINTSAEALMTLSELLLVEGKVVFARQQLRRALGIVPNHPLVLALLSETYLVEAAGYQPEYALQLALSAAQASGWSSPNAMYSLAKAYLVLEDPQAALLVLNKIRDSLPQIISMYRVGESIEQLSEQLSAQVVVDRR